MSTRAAPVDTQRHSHPAQSEARDLLVRLTSIPEDYIAQVDENVRAALPNGTKIKGIRGHGTAYWTRHAAIDTIQADGSDLPFFLKVTRGDVGKSNLRGEFTSMTRIHEAVPDICPRPIATGDYASDPNVHWYLCSFVDMSEEPAELDTLPEKVAELHRKAVSPNRKFGFEVPTNQGAVVMTNEWTSSWEKFFTGIMLRLFAFEERVHGHDEELKELANQMLNKLIPRLLRPLETGGRNIEPCIVHGNLWDGNTSTDLSTDAPVIFDASSMYAHNEYELGAWAQPRHHIYRSYIKEYQRHFQPSEPVEDVEDRLILYRIRFNMTSSGCYLTSTRFRNLAKDDMRMLLEKYPNGYEGPEPRRED